MSSGKLVWMALRSIFLLLIFILFPFCSCWFPRAIPNTVSNFHPSFKSFKLLRSRLFMSSDQRSQELDLRCLQPQQQQPQQNRNRRLQPAGPQRKGERLEYRSHISSLSLHNSTINETTHSPIHDALRCLFVDSEMASKLSLSEIGYLMKLIAKRKYIMSPTEASQLPIILTGNIVGSNSVSLVPHNGEKRMRNKVSSITQKLEVSVSISTSLASDTLWSLGTLFSLAKLNKQDLKAINDACEIATVLLQTLRRKSADISAPSFSKALVGLARLTSCYSSPISSFSGQTQALIEDILVYDDCRIIRCIDARGFSNVVWSLGKLQVDFKGLPFQVQDSLFSQFLAVSSRLTDQGISNSLLGFLGMGLNWESIPVAVQSSLGTAICREFSRMSPQSVGNIMYALGRIGAYSAALPDRVTMALEMVVRKATSTMIKRDSMQILQGMSVMGMKWRDLTSRSQESISMAVYSRANEWKNRGLTNAVEIATIAYSLWTMNASWGDLNPPLRAALLVGCANIGVMDSFQRLNNHASSTISSSTSTATTIDSSSISPPESEASTLPVEHLFRQKQITSMKKSNSQNYETKDDMSFSNQMNEKNHVGETLTRALATLMHCLCGMGASNCLPLDAKKSFLGCIVILTPSFNTQSLIMICRSLLQIGFSWDESSMEGKTIMRLGDTRMNVDEDELDYLHLVSATKKTILSNLLQILQQANIQSYTLTNVNELCKPNTVTDRSLSVLLSTLSKMGVRWSHLSNQDRLSQCLVDCLVQAIPSHGRAADSISLISSLDPHKLYDDQQLRPATSNGTFTLDSLDSSLTNINSRLSGWISLLLDMGLSRENGNIPIGVKKIVMEEFYRMFDSSLFLTDTIDQHRLNLEKFHKLCHLVTKLSELGVCTSDDLHDPLSNTSSFPIIIQRELNLVMESLEIFAGVGSIQILLSLSRLGTALVKLGYVSSSPIGWGKDNLMEVLTNMIVNITDLVSLRAIRSNPSGILSLFELPSIMSSYIKLRELDVYLYHGTSKSLHSIPWRIEKIITASLNQHLVAASKITREFEEKSASDEVARTEFLTQAIKYASDIFDWDFLPSEFQCNLSDFIDSQLSKGVRDQDKSHLCTSNNLINLVAAADAWFQNGKWSIQVKKDEKKDEFIEATERKLLLGINECIRRSLISLSPWDARQILSIAGNNIALERGSSRLLDETLVKALWERVCTEPTSSVSQEILMKTSNASKPLSPFAALKILTRTEAEAKVLSPKALNSLLLGVCSSLVDNPPKNAAELISFLNRLGTSGIAIRWDDIPPTAREVILTSALNIVVQVTLAKSTSVPLQSASSTSSTLSNLTPSSSSSQNDVSGNNICLGVFVALANLGCNWEDIISLRYSRHQILPFSDVGNFLLMHACEDVLSQKNGRKKGYIFSKFILAANTFDFTTKGGNKAWKYLNVDVKRSLVEVITRNLIMNIEEGFKSNPRKSLQVLLNIGATWSTLPTRPRNRLALTLAKLLANDLSSPPSPVSSTSNEVILGLEDLQGKWRMFPIELRETLIKCGVANRKSMSE